MAPFFSGFRIFSEWQSLFERETNTKLVDLAHPDDRMHRNAEAVKGKLKKFENFPAHKTRTTVYLVDFGALNFG